MLSRQSLSIIQQKMVDFQQEQPEVYSWLKSKIEQFGNQHLLIWQAILDFYFWQLVTYPSVSKEQIRLFVSGNFPTFLEQDFSAFRRKWQDWFEQSTENLSQGAKEFIFRMCFELSGVFAPEIIEICSGKSQN